MRRGRRKREGIDYEWKAVMKGREEGMERDK